MEERARFNPVQYVDVSTKVLAGVVVEWNTLWHEAVGEGDPPLVTNLGLQVVESCTAWSRRRGLGGPSPTYAVQDAEEFLLAHPLSTVELRRVGEKVASVASREERVADLLRRIRGAE